MEDDEQVLDDNTLGAIAGVLRKMREMGVHRGSILYVVDRVWWEDEQKAEAGR